MIVKMKKLSLLCMAAEKEASLEKLRMLGVLHVTAAKPPESKELDNARARLARVEKALTALTASDKSKKPDKPGSETNADAVVEKTNALLENKKTLDNEIERLRRQVEKIEPLGDFEPSRISRLSANGIKINLYRVVTKAKPIAPEDSVLEILSTGKSGTYFAIASREAIITDPDWEEIEIPEISLSDTRRRLTGKVQELASAEQEMIALSAHIQLLKGLQNDISRDVEYLAVRSGMGASGMIAYLQGFCPEPELPRVKAVAAEMGWGLIIEDPAPSDNVPTLLRHPQWVKPIKAVFEMINVLPGYKEIDVSAAFLVFFSLFFGMIIGDAGYGALFLIATIFARRKMRSAPGYPFVLLGVLSICTIIWGALTGNYFGIATTPDVLKVLNVEWLNENTNIMKLCFLIGAVHLTIAHAWNAFRIINTPRALAQVGWIFMTWTMFLAANFFVCGAKFPMPAGLILGGMGLALIALFMTPVKQMKTEFIHHAMLPLSVINNFVDVVSYVRLFAVGMASAQVAQSFNSMAMQMGFARIWTVPVVALILLAGHGLNILLCGLGVLVHGVRLNTLEFSNHIGLEWAGFKYTPFKTNDRKTDA